MFYVLFSGVQTQAYRPVDLVLFTESRIWEILAQVNKRQSKGKFCSLFIVPAVFTVNSHYLIKDYVRYLDNLSSNCIKSVGFNKYLLLCIFFTPKTENMPLDKYINLNASNHASAILCTVAKYVGNEI